ncbi:MAG TPA: D-glycerate dehydrogenase [Acidimicrobiia bacterium]|nr:D-glycerate dehydrogenase [Acidimicrobiia bacterium]
MQRVYVSAFVPEDIVGPLRSAAAVGMWEGGGPAPREVMLQQVVDCVGLLSMLVDTIDTELLDTAPRLRVISQMSVGLDNVDLEACAVRGIRVGHTPDVLTETVADTAFALMAAVVRRILEGAAIVRENRWGIWDPWANLGDDLHGSTLGIVGMGRIGQAIARRAAGFAMNVVYSSPSDKRLPDATHLAIDELLGMADLVVLAAPLTPGTRHLIGAAQLGSMKDSSYLINVARGGLVDTAALVDALQRGAIRGAALDVTDPEPLPPGHPLLAMENCLIVPHIGSASINTRRAMARLAVDNLITGLGGGTMAAPFRTGSVGPDA